jgi:hypothetical protein
VRPNPSGDRPATGGGAGADNLTISLSTGATVAQASPGAQVITATPTGGTGSKTYAWGAIYINSGADAVALLSASTGNPVTLTTTTAGQQVQVVCTATDGGSPAQTAVAAVAVAVTPGPAWVTRLDYDATAPATFGALAAGSNVIGALTWTVTTAVPVTIDHTQGTGITVSALVTALQALQTNVHGVLVGPHNSTPVRVSMVVDSITINTNSQSVSLATTSSVQATTGSSRCPAFCLRLHRTGATDFKMRTMTNGTGTMIGGTNGLIVSTGVTVAASLPSSAVYEHYLYGPLAGGLITTGTTTIPTAVDPFTVFETNTTYNRASFMAAVADRTTAIDSWPALWVGPGITATGTLAYTYIIKRILIQEWV